MSNLYPHKTRGWQILYGVHSLDGNKINKVRWAKSKAKAMAVYTDVTRLESISRQGALTRDEVVYALNKGYVNEKEAALLTRSRIAGKSGWNGLRKKYEDWSRAHCRKSTHAVNMFRLGKVIEYVEEKDAGGFSEEDVRRYIQKRKGAGAKDWTVRHEQVILRKLLDYLGGENPARKTSLIRANDETIPQAFTRTDLAKFMRLVKNKRAHLHGYLRPVTLTYLYAGLRPSELVRLTPRDIKAGKILVQGETKTGRPRSVDIHPRLAPHINACLRQGGVYLFGGDTQLRSETIGLTLRRIISEAKIEGVSPYSLRHTFITGLLRAGADLRYVMDKAGHRKLTTTTRYLHVIETADSPVRRIKF